MVHLGEVSPKVCETIIEKLEDFLGNNELQDDMMEFSWRKSANRRKFDRELFEKYGYFKDIILNPKYQHAKQYLEENANFDVVLGDPLLPTTTAVIVLFMLHKRVSNTAIGLAALFLFNVNPLYVCLSAALLWLLSGGKLSPKQYKRPDKSLSSAQSTASNNQKELSIDQCNTATMQTEYDHVLIGNDIGTLYTAALLSKNGHRCCILKPASLGPLYEIHPVGAPCAAPIVNLSIGRVERYQALLDATVCSKLPSDRVTFAPVGTEPDGYTSSILHTTAVPAGGAAGMLGSRLAKPRGTYTHLRVGQHALPHDLCTVHPLEKSTLIAALQARLYSALPFLTTFLVSRAVPAEEWGRTPQAQTEGSKLFKTLSSTSTEQVVHSLGVESSPEAVAVLEGLAAVGAGEGITAADSSAYMLAGTLFNASQGLFYPIGGPAALVAALTRTIHSAGGVVYSDVNVQDIVLEEIEGSKVIRATGVSVALESANPASAAEAASEFTFHANKSVISGTGVLNTYTKLLPPEAVSASAKEMLSGLVETRPRVKVIYWVRGQQSELGLSSTDYYQLGPQPALQRQQVPSTGVEGEETQVGAVLDCAENDLKRDKFAADFVHIWSPSCKDPTWTERHGGDLHVVVVEMELSQPFVDVKEFTFPATETAEEQVPAGPEAVAAGLEAALAESATVPGPRIFYSTHQDDAQTDPAHPDYPAFAGKQATLSKSKQDKIQQRADRLLGALYGNVLSRVQCSCVHLPVLSGGTTVSCTASKFGSKLSAVMDIQNLYLTGRDLGTSGLAGDLQGGWAGANAVLGYTLRDMIGSRNIVSDLANVKCSL